MTEVISPLPRGVFSAPSSTAGGLLAYLTENDNNLKIRALHKLYQIIDIHWAEIWGSLPLIEELSEDSSFPAADLAAAIASKCFYHLQEYDDSLKLALTAGKYFDISVKSEYIDTLLVKCIDDYKTQRQLIEAAKDANTMTVPIDPRIEQIMEQMYQRCYRDSCYEQALGIALDTLSLNKVEEVCVHAIRNGKESILNYAYNLCQGARNITSRKFRLSVMDVLVKLYITLPEPDYSNMCFGLQYLNRPEEVAVILHGLISSSCTTTTGSSGHELMAYQIAFDLLEAENQGFILKVMSHFDTLSSGPGASEEKSSDEEEAPSPPSPASEFQDRVKKLKKILTENFDVDLILNFLFKQSHSDLNVLRTIKASTEGRSNILHDATVVSHAYMNGGTTKDNFLRDNLDWLGKASNWAKFTAVGSIGVVHKGHVHESMSLLQPYLPQAGQSSSPYSESGALYALGLIHANKGGSGDSSTISFLTDSLRNAGNAEIVQHGACLGIGLAAMATGSEGLFETLNEILYSDSAVAGEGAALGIGLLMVGQCDSELATRRIPELLTYSHDNHHEKVVRAVALSIAMMVYGKEESADIIIETLTGNRDPIIRYGGMFAIAMAYCGTADNKSIQKLLHVAVSDVNDDVRRAAVSAFGFLNFRNPESVPRLVALLAESFNPHVRYGACMAVGIACAGTASKDAVDLLTPLLEDNIDYVRQGALIAMALVYQEISEARSPSSKKFRETLLTLIADKHQTVMTKAGAILAAGIIDAGGRNCVVSIQSRTGFMKMGGAVGIMMFLQYWYWYPLKLFLSLSFNATVLIGLNKDFDMPNNFEVDCNAPPSMFAYPKVEEKKEEEKKLVATAVLSTTVKAKAREARKEALKLHKPLSSSSHDVQSADNLDVPIPMERVASHLSTLSYISLGEDGGDHHHHHTSPFKQLAAKKDREPTCFTVKNPSRLLASQIKYISLQEGQRYVPVISRTTPAGIVMLRDCDPSEPENVAKVERVAIGQEDEADAPEPFMWDPNDP